MRGTVAKRLRKMARKLSGPSKLMVKVATGELVYQGYRRVYRDLKKSHKHA